MWIEPIADSWLHLTLWSSLKETPIFKLQIRKGSDESITANKSFFKKSLNVVTNAIVGTYDSFTNNQNVPYRVIYEDPLNKLRYVVAVAADLAQAEKLWEYLQEIEEVGNNIEDFGDKSSYFKGKIWYLGLQSNQMEDSTTNLEDSKPNTILRFRSLFNFPSKEILIEDFSCLIAPYFPHNTGCLYLSKNYISFYSFFFGQKEKIIIPFLTISSISKSDVMTSSSTLIISTVEVKEYRFTGFQNFGYCFAKINGTYNEFLSNMMESHIGKGGKIVSTKISRNHFQSKIDIENDTFNYRFRLPFDEVIDDVFGLCSLKLINKLYIHPGVDCQSAVTTHFICLDCKMRNFVITIPLRKIVEAKSKNGNDSSSHILYLYLEDKSKLKLIGINDIETFTKNINKKIAKVKEQYLNVKTTQDSFGCFEIKQNTEPDYSVKEGCKYKKFITENETDSKYYIDPECLASDVIWGNFPLVYRRKLWVLLSGAAFEIETHPNHYQNMLELSDRDELVGAIKEEIDKDLGRSLPEHPSYKESYGKESLRRVLLAYAAHNPTIGYCQSMNLITAVLLLYCNEEESFWILSKICERILPNYFIKNMGGYLTDEEVIKNLLEKYFGDFKDVIIRLGVIQHITSSWFMTLFLNIFPLNCGLHFFDCLFLIGECFIFQFCLGILKCVSSRLKNIEDGSDASMIIGYFLRNKIVTKLKSVNLSSSNSSYSLGDETFEKLNDVPIEKLFYLCAKKFREITNTSIREYRIKSQHKSIIKLEESALKSVTRFVCRRLGMEESIATILIHIFREAHYKTKFWGNHNSYVSTFNSSWKTSVDAFLVDIDSFYFVFNKVMRFGHDRDMKEFSNTCFKLLSRADRNNGLVDFSQFIILYKMIGSDNVDLKILLLYQMSYTDLKNRSFGASISKSDCLSISTNEDLLSIKSETSYPNFSELIQFSNSSDTSSDGNTLSADKILTNIRRPEFLTPLKIDDFMQLWIILQKLCENEIFESDIIENVSLFTSKVKEGYTMNNSNWTVDYTLIKEYIYSFPSLIDLINRRVTLASIN